MHWVCVTIHVYLSLFGQKAQKHKDAVRTYSGQDGETTIVPNTAKYIKMTTKQLKMDN